MKKVLKTQGIITSDKVRLILYLHVYLQFMEVCNLDL